LQFIDKFALKEREDSMKMESKYNIGDTVYSSYPNATNNPLTIGKIILSITDSPGVDNSMFDNFKKQKGVSEKYMCVETGIGSGSVFSLDRLHLTPDEAINKLKQILKKEQSSCK